MGSISDSDSNDDEPSSAQTSYDLGKGVAIPRCELMQGLPSNVATQNRFNLQGVTRQVSDLG